MVTMDLQQWLEQFRVDDEKLAGEFSEAMTFVTMFSGLISYCAFKVNYGFTNCPAENPTAVAIVCPRGNYVYFDVTLWSKLTVKQRAFLIVHEIMHIFLAHGHRGYEMNYVKEVWDYAVDYFVNGYAYGYYLCKSSGTVRREQRAEQYLEVIPDSVCKPLLDERFTGMSSDDIYHQLMEEGLAEKLKAKEPQKGQGNGAGNGGDQNGEPSGRTDGCLDPHHQTDTIDPETQKQMQENEITLMAGVEAAKNGKNIGQGDLGLIKYISSLVAPVVSWEEHLRSTMKSRVPIRTSYNRISRRRSGGVVFPTYMGDHLDVVFGFDSSGSMGHDDIVRAYSEAVGVLEELDSFTIKIVSCDTKAHVVGEYDNDNYVTPEDMELKVVGGGGTYMSPIADYCAELVESGENVDLLVIVSDGEIFDHDLSGHTGETSYEKVFITTRRNATIDGWVNIHLPTNNPKH